MPTRNSKEGVGGGGGGGGGGLGSEAKKENRINWVRRVELNEKVHEGRGKDTF